MTRPNLPGPGWRFLTEAELEKPLPMDAMASCGGPWYESSFRGTVCLPDQLADFYATQSPTQEPSEPSDEKAETELATLRETLESAELKIEALNIAGEQVTAKLASAERERDEALTRLDELKK